MKGKFVMEVPPDFDWKMYLELNEDLSKYPHYTTQAGAISHWKLYGSKEGRPYKRTQVKRLISTPVPTPEPEIFVETKNNVVEKLNNSKKLLTIVVPNKMGQTPHLTINSLYKQTFTNFDIIVVNDNVGNANMARNRGLNLVETPYVLFSDNDIEWEPDALENMIICLEENSNISFAYGYWEIKDKSKIKINSNKEWNVDLLYKENYISMMSIVRTEHHPGFDDGIKRFQDWDVWLTMVNNGYTGKFINKKIFSTPFREDGITNNSINSTDAITLIKRKHFPEKYIREGKILVVIPAYNAELTILDSINSVKNQTYKNIEIVVVDDCSSDNTYDIIKNIDGITVYRMEKNVGTYESINYGLNSLLDFDYFTIHGADDIMYEDKIKKQIDAIVSNNVLASVAGYERVNFYTNEVILSKKTGDSMVIYSKKVFDDIGYYDNNRFGADSEYFKRFKHLYDDNYVKMNEILTKAYLIKENNLTSIVKLNSDARLKYVERYSREHDEMVLLNNFYRDYKPKNYISVNMATYPPRKTSLIEVLNNLLEIDIINVIRVYLNEYEEIPDDLPKDEKIIYLVGKENLKDSGKFYWAGIHKNEYYFTIDDDLIYPKSYFLDHIEKLNLYDDKIFVSLHGKEMKKSSMFFNDVEKQYHCLKDVDNDVWVNNCGTGVMVFNNNKFVIPLDLFTYHGMTDMWIAYYCQKNKIPMLCRKHKKSELKYINQKDTLFDRREEMKKDHKFILDKIGNWKMYKYDFV